MVKKETVRLYKELEKQFSSLQIVYLGRGFHIHLLNEDTFNRGYGKKKIFAKELKKKGFLFNEWVTTGGMCLIRLPYSLHGRVSRIASPLTNTPSICTVDLPIFPNPLTPVHTVAPKIPASHRKSSNTF